MQIHLYRGDITKMGVDAIVNAAKPSLLGGGGVDGAIHAAAGPQLKEACRLLRGCAVGQAKITPGFDLPAAYVIHTVGPIWQGGAQQEEQKLRSCYHSCLALCRAHQIGSVAFPAISCGVYGYPKRAAAAVAWQAVRDDMQQNPLPLQIYFVAFDTAMEQIYREIIPAASIQA